MSGNPSFGQLFGGMVAEIGRGLIQAAGNGHGPFNPHGMHFHINATRGFGSDSDDDIHSDSEQSNPADAFDQVFAGFGNAFQNFTDNLEQPSQPATSSAALKSLPVIKIAQKDIESEQDSECVVCLEKFQIGDAATRIPCGHLFHEGCVKKWLANSNQCPICRYELPTDSTSYENKRRRRMNARTLRMRLSDLSARTARELRHLAEHLNVDIRGCLEKDDIVRRIVSSGCIDVISEDQSDCSSSVAPTRSTAAQPAPSMTRSRLNSMHARDIKLLMERLGVNTQGCLEKQELIDRLATSGYLIEE